MRPLRYVPPGGGLFETTSRTLQGRFLLRPSESLNEIIVGALGRPAILKVDPYSRPQRLKRSVAPRVHAATRRVRRQLKEAYAAFVEAYRVAATKLRQGDPTAQFPDGCFPPAQPFVPVRAGPILG